MGEGLGFLPPAWPPLHSRSGPAQERALDFITRPLGTDSQSALFKGQNLFITHLPSGHCCGRGHWGSYQHTHFVEEKTEALTEKRQTQVTWKQVLDLQMLKSGVEGAVPLLSDPV